MSAVPTTSFWNLSSEEQVSPATILSKQADALTRQTKGLLVGEVLAGEPSLSSSGKPTLLKLTLMVRVPGLNDYRLGICRVEFPMHMKQIILRDLIAETQKGSTDLVSFEKALQACLGSEEVSRILAGLMTAARATVGSTV